jgi:antitoxin ParD1/3/4
VSRPPVALHRYWHAIVGIRIDQVEVDGPNSGLRRPLERTVAEAEGWFTGPPYAVSEVVFDEDDLPACSPEPDNGFASELCTAGISDERIRTPANIARAEALREQASVGGLCFRAYLPPTLAEWLLDLITRGKFTEPGEAVSVKLSEQRELEQRADLLEESSRRSCHAKRDDPRPDIWDGEIKERMERLLATPYPSPAIWREQ